MKKLCLLLLLIWCRICYSQTTSVSATVTDPQGQVWYGGTYDFQLKFPSGYSTATFNGTPLPNSTYRVTGVLDGTGSFTVSVLDNSLISPAGTYWQITICSKTSSPVETTGGSTVSPCYFINLPVSGPTQSITTQLSSKAPTPLVNALLTPFAYRESELQSALGGIYWDNTAACLKVWDGSAWTCIGTGGGGGGSGTVNAGNQFQSVTYPLSGSHTVVGPGICVDNITLQVFFCPAFASTGPGTLEVTSTQVNGGLPAVTAAGSAALSWDINGVLNCSYNGGAWAACWTGLIHWTDIIDRDTTGVTDFSNFFDLLTNITCLTPFVCVGGASVGQIGPSSMTDDGVAPVTSQDGLNVRSAGSYSVEVAVNTTTGVGQNLTGCDDGTGKLIICDHTTSATNVPLGVVLSCNNGAFPPITVACAITGNAVISAYGFLPVKFDNTATALHFAQQSTTVDGELTDVGATKPTNGLRYYFIWTGNSGAGTIGSIRLFTAGELAAANGALITATSPMVVTPSPITGAGVISAILQGTDSKLLTSGTVSGTAVTLCTDANGGATTTGCPSGINGSMTFQCANDATGTTVNRLARFQPGSASLCEDVGTGATASGTAIIGITVSGAGTTGYATVIRQGAASCDFDNATTQGDSFVWSVITAGKCHDTGTRAGANYGAKNDYGYVQTTNGAAGTYTVDLAYVGAAASGGAITNFIPVIPAYTGMMIPSPISVNTVNDATSQATVVEGEKLCYDSGGNLGGVGCNYANRSGSNAGWQFQCDKSASGYSCEFTGGVAAATISDHGITSGSVQMDMAASQIHKVTANGAITIANPANIVPGQIFKMVLCENGTGGFAYSFGTSWVTTPTVPTTASQCHSYSFTAVDTTHIYADGI